MTIGLGETLLTDSSEADDDTFFADVSNVVADEGAFDIVVQRGLWSWRSCWLAVAAGLVHR
jgi:hypothetical protein